MTESWTAVEWTRFVRRCRQHDVDPPEVEGCEDEARELDYYGWAHSRYCEGVFRCTRCRRLVCFCSGGGDDDERGDYCAECWAVVTCANCDDGVLRFAGQPDQEGICDSCHATESIGHRAGIEPPAGTKGWTDAVLKLGG